MSTAPEREMHNPVSEQPSPTADEWVSGSPAQRDLLKRYRRTFGWLLGIGLVMLFGAVTNVIQGRNEFGSLPMFIEFGIALALLVPAFITRRRRSRLEHLIEEGSDEVPRHLRAWQVALVVVGVVLAFMFATSMAVAATAPDTPTVEELRSQELAQVRADYANEVLRADLPALCAIMADPSRRGEFLQIGLEDLQKQDWSGSYLTPEDHVRVLVEEADKVCGLR